MCTVEESNPYDLDRDSIHLIPATVEGRILGLLLKRLAGSPDVQWIAGLKKGRGGAEAAVAS